MSVVADELVAARADEQLRRAQLGLDQAVRSATRTVQGLEERAAQQGRRPGERAAALRRRLDVARGRQELAAAGEVPA